MLENLIHRANQLSLDSRPAGGKSSRKGAGRRSPPRSLSGAQYRDSSSGDYSDTSVAIRSDDDFGRIGYSYEYSEHEVITAPPQTSSHPSCNQQDPGSHYPIFNADSPGAQILVSLKQEAVQDKRQRSKWNRYKFYCQICKVNISIFARGHERF